jgi:cytochrome c oxidase subunit 3
MHMPTQTWSAPEKQRRASMTGTYVLLAAITMMFAAFSSALVVRRGLGDDWTGIPIPDILWVSTAFIVASSIVLEMARRGAPGKSFTMMWTIGTLLGFGFLAGQYTAWTQLQAAGMFIATTPGNSFFYLFTVAHAVHVLGGIGWLSYVEIRALASKLGSVNRTAVEAARLYWHFLAGLWVYLILLFKFWG